MYTSIRNSPLLLAAGIIITNSISACAPDDANDEPNGDSILEYDRNPNTVVVEMRFWDLTGVEIPAPLRIYGDGTVIVSMPTGTPDEGIYESSLTESEMRDLL